MTESLPRAKLLAASACLFAAALAAPERAAADAGPPFITNDPGTPGNGDWEINIAAMQTTVPDESVWQLPQLDVNYGLGERIQLTFEVPYVVVNQTGEPQTSGWGNANLGVKWRFYDKGEGGWSLSTFPMYQTGGSAEAQRKGIAAAGPRLFLPLEVARKVGWLSVDLEVGTYVPWHGAHEDILGLVVGRQFGSRLELDAEFYEDHVRGSEDVTTLDVGGRYHLHRGFNLLFMAGRSLRGNSPGQVEFMGYLGVQILLSHYGRTLSEEP
ncbi:MAG TPA: hypothetical protein VKB20_06390 [Steroidobacteraceae bacterium]|nr:hypothetical protein [Steroidobacteraceae bacterium]